MEQPQTRQQGTQRSAVHPALTPSQQKGNWLPFTSAVQETMKTSELGDEALNWAVAKCEVWPMDIWYDEDQLPMIRDDEVPEWKPSTDWAQGGPIIEREKMELHPAGNDWSSDINRCYQQYGSTPLIAAMRCYVQSKLGDEVKIPEELK